MIIIPPKTLKKAACIQHKHTFSAISTRENHKTREGENEFETDGRDAGKGWKGQERAAHSDEDDPEEVGRRQPILFLPGH